MKSNSPGNLDRKKTFIFEERWHQSQPKAIWVFSLWFLVETTARAATSDGRLVGFSQGGWIHLLAWGGLVGMGLLVAALLRSVRRLRCAEAKLHETEEQMTLSAEAAHLGMWQWDLKQDTVWISEKLRRLYATSAPDEVTPRAFLAAIHPEDRHAAKKAINDAIENKTPYDARYRILKTDGSVRWINSVGRLTTGTPDKRAVLMGVAMDITEQMETREELNRHRAELAHMSRLSVLGELSASISHELNQPLTAILANAQAAQRFMDAGENDLEEFRNISKDIEHDTTRARDVIRHLRALIQKGEVQFRRLELNEVIQEVIVFLHGEMVGRNMTVKMELAPDLPAIHGDQTQIQQVLLNLLLNAFDAMTDNSLPDRRVTIATVLESPATVRVSIRDQGTGLAPGQIEKLFHSFYTTKSKGLGIGLSVSRTIIESHGGRVWAENNSNARGATFSFTLSASVSADEESDSVFAVRKEGGFK